MILVAVAPDGELLKKTLPIDDPSPEQVKLDPNQAITGEFDLREIFDDLAEISKKSDIQLFWAYEAPAELHISRWSGGWTLIPKQK